MNKRLKIYGERNTGTNYISKLIALNLEVEQLSGVVPDFLLRLCKYLPGDEWLRDLYFLLSFGSNLGWKHAKVKPAEEIDALITGCSEICFITLTKNPYSWLLSLHHRHYHQKYLAEPNFETFLLTPWKTSSRENCKTMLKSPIELWNLKNASYLQLPPHRSLNLKTESILLSPESVIEKIASTFAVERTSTTFINYEQSTKDNKKDFSYYQNYYLRELWREKLSEESISIINQNLDSELMDHYGYCFIL